ncbi:hypothetical protein QWI17_15985 [Gilvimarinus sp. SDUM040013]|uniref:Uncharacterized protein n=1 Tax=Gilvimarinus gilvus TaxID=3058038 RepID=A0ABU4RVY0_9GAMM|nr:hypothetical protein [Gilvimarinus sp. SDUM040013]MDO3387341.1 hypothetical protein [Gilvimarinus sp. SDUM040013]MDX6849030.1 hypothetical protein [Gilvimarinus sp. SDUM040013]
MVALHGEHWGMKDPRQCVFLPHWQQVVGDRGRYLVVLRHWSASIQSLLKRSTRDIALGVRMPPLIVDFGGQLASGQQRNYTSVAS